MTATADPRTGSAVLAARNLSVLFRSRRSYGVRAVDDVNLALEQGEILALVGESGCGKTTLARTLLGLERPASGRVEYAGEPLTYTTKRLRKYRRQVQLVLQDPTGALNPRHTVYQLVAQGVRIHRLVAQRHRAGERSTSELDLVAAALTSAGLRPPERFFHAFPHELSGGQRQRVVIAGALALDPTVLVADEPVSSLDASIRGEILSLLLRLREERGLTVLVVTHDLGLAWNIADRIAVMYLGRIVEIGPAEQVLTDPQHPYTQALISVVPETTSRQPIVLRGETPDASRIPPGCRFHPRCPALADGTSEAAGIATRCVSDDPGVLPLLGTGADGSTPGAAAVPSHMAACWLRTATRSGPSPEPPLA